MPKGYDFDISPLLCAGSNISILFIHLREIIAHTTSSPLSLLAIPLPLTSSFSSSWTWPSTMTLSRSL
jgi:hypothetical protein